MIFINPDQVCPGEAWEKEAEKLANELISKPLSERSAFIEEHREDTWGHPSLLAALRLSVGNKCWYSEVPLEGADPNIDHFRPKGRIREVDGDLKNTKTTTSGYWWLAFELRNFRLASMHSNQRRVDESTEGGKWDYFPIRGARTPEGTEWGLIVEDILALDPCSVSDVRLLWFEPDANAACSPYAVSDEDKERVKATIWLYHLNKVEIQAKRLKEVEGIRTDLRKADIEYKLWEPSSGRPNLLAKSRFDSKVAEIKVKISPNSEFSGAKRCAVRLAISKYSWIEEFNIL